MSTLRIQTLMERLRIQSIIQRLIQAHGAESALEIVMTAVEFEFRNTGVLNKHNEATPKRNMPHTN